MTNSNSKNLMMQLAVASIIGQGYGYLSESVLKKHRRAKKSEEILKINSKIEAARKEDELNRMQKAQQKKERKSKNRG